MAVSLKVTPCLGRLLAVLSGGAVFSVVTRPAMVFGRVRGAGHRHGHSLGWGRHPSGTV